MSKTPRTRPDWAGLSLLAIAGLHTLLGLLLGSRLLPDAQMQALAGERAPLWELTPGFGLNPHDGVTLTMFWFLFFGFALVPLGWLIRHMETRRMPVPKALGYQLLALGLSGGVLLPASGFWLALIPAWRVLRPAHR